jgi:hypothetical protein
MIRNQLDAEPQLVRPSHEASEAIDQWEPAADLTRRAPDHFLVRRIFQPVHMSVIRDG